MDTEGYLYLSDRKSFMIISGGVNIYPQEIENLLITHNKVADVAVIGLPDEEMGEMVVAVVQPADGVTADATLAQELTIFARCCLSPIKVPRRVEFVQSLPRQANGKLYKRELKERFVRHNA
jgi:long-chain acyl-CoA synthetase